MTSGGAQTVLTLTHTPVPSTVTCDTCHNSTTVWTTGAMNHSVVSSTPCATCHNGNYTSQSLGLGGAQAVVTGTHIPVPSTVTCDTCHNSTTVWTTGAMNHSVVSSTPCASCHNGSYTSQSLGLGGAQAVVTGTHIPVPSTVTCDTCHSSTTVWTS